MRLIDADALIKKWENVHSKDMSFEMAIIGATNDVKNAPTIDAVPVKHGKWIQVGHIEHMQIVYKCSACNGQTIVDGNFCPNCGARMDEHETD